MVRFAGKVVPVTGAASGIEALGPVVGEPGLKGRFRNGIGTSAVLCRAGGCDRLEIHAG